MSVGTEPVADPQAADVPAYRAFHVRVRRVSRISPSFTRVTLAGDDLRFFADRGLDQRINLIFPHPEHGYPVFPEQDDWYLRWRAMPPERRNPLRTYTAGAVRHGARELDVEFVLHGATGPASRWAETARPGDPLVVIGPDARHRGEAGGREWSPPPDATRLLLAGDETAVPAIRAIAESLPAHVYAEVILEVPDHADGRPLLVPPGVRVTWLPRRGPGVPGHGHGERLSAAVREAASRLVAGGRRARGPEGAEERPAGRLEDVDVDAEILWEVPDAGSAAAQRGFYAWLAGEAGVVKLLRRHLVGDLGVDRGAVAFMGYWRLGRSDIG
ncbi:siderophore-interacting protein [Sphaerisporangium melleum]|uniref:Siderophore-interacting protein n=1 Tax=Sphaerisporangium melleum TaxID=321316 RepID=A0A917VJK8_9ACTN|nr:siderophore-interacting protein [Sphaerisporangium melleum]GGK87543.1 siderophore-interacting protein [Sphaerisporangium melleum]GII72418.1 siderophore-interacting protein [Sphaerisporangium melleum]